jgi:hypothetical protein
MLLVQPTCQQSLTQQQQQQQQQQESMGVVLGQVLGFSFY